MNVENWSIFVKVMKFRGLFYLVKIFVGFLLICPFAFQTARSIKTYGGAYYRKIVANERETKNSHPVSCHLPSGVLTCLLNQDDSSPLRY